MKKLSINKTISTSLIFAAFVIIIAGIIYAKNVINPFLMAVFISIIVLRPIRWLQSKKVPESLSILIVFIFIIAIFFGFGQLISASLSSFSQDVPKYQQSLRDLGVNTAKYFNEKGFKISANNLLDILDASKVMGITSKILGQLGDFMGKTITIFILMLFLLFEKHSLGLKVKAIAKSTNISLTYLRTIGNNIRHYLSIKTMTSLITGILIWIFLEIIGLNYALLWGLIAFLLNYIPSIGSFIAAFPAVLFALVDMEVGGVVWTIITFVTVNIIIGSIVEPKAMGKGMGLSTFIVFAGLIFWGFILGTVGMFLSVPLTMTIKIILEQKENTRWIAIILGTQEDALAIIDEKKNQTNNS
jgi:AI-2 transport protein TqsA